MPALLDPCVIAYRDICLLAEPKISENPAQQFFPWDSLWEYFKRNNRAEIRKVLQCPCNSCTSDAELFDRVSEPVQYIDHILGPELPQGDRPDWDRTAVCLFALFVYVRRPRFITPFLQQNRYDPHLEEYTGTESIDVLPQKYWQKYANNEPEHSRALARQVYDQISKFAVPRLDSSRYVSWSGNRILPFLEEEELGSKTETGNIRPDGANSRVFAFKIHSEYSKFMEHPDIEIFARKEIQASSNIPPLLVLLEKQALERVGSLSHRHIVRMIKSYKLGDNYNIVFPCAKTNLDKYLRDPQYGAEEKREGPFEQSPLWEQLVGITEALAEIHSFGETVGKMDDATDDERLIGFHFDIKDANILVELNDEWVISDFGQAMFKDVERGGTTTRVLNNQGGTDAYAPPEFNSSFEKLSRGFDIWSLGCIFLEVVSFLVRGYDGLIGTETIIGLDQARHTTKTDGPRREDYRFYTEASKRGSFIIKPSVAKFMKEMKQHLTPTSPKSEKLLDEVIGLVRRMLTPLASKRPRALEVHRELKGYLEKARLSSQVNRNHNRNTSSPFRGAKEVESQALRNITEAGLFLWNGTGKNYETVVELRIHQKEGPEIQMVNVKSSTDAGVQPEIHIPLLQKSALVPYFAFPTKGQDKRTRPAISFITEKGRSGFGKVGDLDYDFTGGSPAYKRQLQSIMTGQTLSDSFVVSDLTMTAVPQSVLKRIFKRVFKEVIRWKKSTRDSNRDKQLPEIEGTEARVELWTQCAGAMPQAEQPKPQSRAQQAKQSHNEVDPCRIVFYCGRSIIMVRIAQNQKIEEHSNPSRKSNRTQLLTLTIVPTDESRDVSFQATTIQPLNPEDTDSYAAIPLDHEWLQRLEEGVGADEFRCHNQEYISISFRFQDALGEAQKYRH